MSDSTEQNLKIKKSTETSRALYFEISINKKQEKRHLNKYIVDEAINLDGIIFGGFVRDNIISSHNTKIFKQTQNIDFYWLDTFDQSTKDRLLEPVDIDIYFNKSKNFKSFIALLRLKYKVKLIKNDSKYISGNKYRHKKYELVDTLVKTSNVELTQSVILDITISQENSIKEFEPTFNRVDYITNTLVIDKSGIRISKNTGLKEIDNLEDFEKLCLTNNIVKLILKKETYMINDLVKFPFLHKRFSKMLEKEWKILNLPSSILQIDLDLKTEIETETETETETESKAECRLCLSRSNGKCIKIGPCIYHKSCFCKYLDTCQDNSTCTLKCPNRNYISFNNLNVPESFLNCNNFF